MSSADRAFWQLDTNDSSGQRVRSAISNLAFFLVLGLAVLGSWLFGPKISVVLSHSMDPTYTAGDALFVVPWGTPGVGDIVQFRVPLAPGQEETTVPITHRIVGQDERGFITKGDNPSATPDYWRVTPDMIDGQVVFWMPQVWMFRIAAGLIGIAVLTFLWPAKEQDLETAALPPPQGPPIGPFPIGQVRPLPIPTRSCLTSQGVAAPRPFAPNRHCQTGPGRRMVPPPVPRSHPAAAQPSLVHKWGAS